MASSRTYGLIGAGRLGSALGEGLVAAGYTVARVASRGEASARALCARLPGARPGSAAWVVEGADVVFLAVPDDAVAAVAGALPWRADQGAVYLSGALDLGVLARASKCGALRGCLHPLQSFPDTEGGAERFRGVVCGMEGEGFLAQELAALCQALGARSVSLAGVDRARYHTAAVFASNYVVALHAAAAAVWDAAGLPTGLARTALSPLTAGTAENLARLPTHEALTGPIARGDVATIARHLEALAGLPAQRALYRALGRQLLELPLTLPEERRAELARLLADDAPIPPSS